jgi:COP9 signalosome complex subunit 7
VSTLHAWSSRCTTTLSTLERQIAAIKADAQRRHKEERDWEKYVDKLVAAETGGKKDKSGNGSGNGMAIGQIKLGRRGVTMKRLYDGENREGGEEDIEDVDMEDEEDGWSQEGVPSSKKRGLSGGLGFGR